MEGAQGDFKEFDDVGGIITAGEGGGGVKSRLGHFIKRVFGVLFFILKGTGLGWSYVRSLRPHTPRHL